VLFGVLADRWKLHEWVGGGDGELLEYLVLMGLCCALQCIVVPCSVKVTGCREKKAPSQNG